MHIVLCLPTNAGMASQTNLRDEPQAKSRTLSALKIHVLVVVAFPFSAFVASSKVTTSVTSFAVCAVFQRANCADDKTCAAFCISPF